MTLTLWFLNIKLSLSRNDMIGLPYNFQHVSHAGFDRDNNFSQFNIEKQVEDQIRELFKEVSFLSDSWIKGINKWVCRQAGG